MVWKLQEENETLKDCLSVLVQSVDEDSGSLLKSAFLRLWDGIVTISHRKIKESSVDSIAPSVKEFAAKAKQKQWTLENKLKKNECQLKTLAIDAKTREQVCFIFCVLTNKKKSRFG